jgi:hypothetical protein
MLQFSSPSRAASQNAVFTLSSSRVFSGLAAAASSAKQPSAPGALALQDGLESTWAVNVAAPFLLTGDLLDLVVDRVVNVSSISMADRLDFEDLQQVPRSVLAGWLAGMACSSCPLKMLTSPASWDRVLAGAGGCGRRREAAEHAQLSCGATAVRIT